MATWGPGDLKTNTDREVERFRPVVANAGALRRARATGEPGTVVNREGAIEGAGNAALGALAYGLLERKNPEYDAELWQECRALYAGGPRLLRDLELMERLFPPHNAEDEVIYRERVKRAHYFPYAGAITDTLVAGLGADPIRLRGAGEDDEGDDLPGWYTAWAQDVSPPGGERQGLAELAVEMIREALITQWCWVLVDREQVVAGAFSDRLEQEQAGALDPYCAIVPRELVHDWEEDDAGELSWVLLCDTECRRPTLADDRVLVTKTYTSFDRAGWKRWRVTYHPDRPPKPSELIAVIDEGTHELGRVPLERLRLPYALWAMGKLESLAREHLNKRNAQAWAEYKSLFRIHYEFLAPEDPFAGAPVSEAGADPGRATNQVYGQGHVQLRGHQDRVEYVGPDVAPFAEARASCQEIMREMHRVMFVMAASAEMNTAALQRSGESKREDHRATEVVLAALGRLLREAMRRVLDMVLLHRGDELDAPVDGAEHFDAEGVWSAIEEAVELLNGVPMKSPTFQRLYLYRLYRRILGDHATDEQLAEIKRELEQIISPEAMLMDPSSFLPPDGGAGDPDDDEGDEDDAPRGEPSGPAPPRRSRRMIGSM